MSSYIEMRERYTREDPRRTAEHSHIQYKNVLSYNAETRRALYSYEVPPWLERQPYDIWHDMSYWLQVNDAKRVFDLGANDGSFHNILRHNGFKGEFFGIDKAGEQLPGVEYMARRTVEHLSSQADNPEEWANAKSTFLEGDASNLKALIPDNSADSTIAAFIAYHMDKRAGLFDEVHRITEDNGVAIFATRDVMNQLDTWRVARLVAHNSGFAFPIEIGVGRKEKRGLIGGVPIEDISVYSNFGIDAMARVFRRSKRYRLIRPVILHGLLWIPANEKGFYDFADAVESLLLYTEKIDSGERPSEHDLDRMYKWIQSFVRDYFYKHAEHLHRSGELRDIYRRETGRSLPKYPESPYYISHVRQAFFVTRVQKS